MRHFRADKKHRGAIRARRGARTTADARGGFHGGGRLRLRARQRIRVLRRAGARADETARPLYAFERTTIDKQIANDWKRFRMERFDVNRIAVIEFAHEELTGRGLARPVRNAIDGQRTRAADAFAAIVIERDWFLTFPEQIFIHDI